MHGLALAVPPFYRSAIFWASAGVVAAVFFGIVAFLTYWLGPPRPVIVYRMVRVTPLVSGHALGGVAGEIEVKVKGVPVDSPYVAELNVECKGRQDISSDHFDHGEPLVFDLGAPIVTVLRRGPDEVKNADTQGSKVRIGPCLLHRGPVLSIDVLTDGRPTVTCEAGNNPLVNVRVRESGADRRASRWRNVVAVVLGAALGGAALWLGIAGLTGALVTLVAALVVGVIVFNAVGRRSRLPQVRRR